MHEKLAAECQMEQSASQEPAQPASPLSITLNTPELRKGVWRKVIIALLNTGNQDLTGVSLSLSEEVEAKRLRPVDIKAGVKEVLEIAIKPRDEGNIPLDVTVTYTDQSGDIHTENCEFWLDVLE
jgi:hypothetical protein